MSLWLKMSFLSEKHSLDILMLIYISQCLMFLWTYFKMNDLEHLQFLHLLQILSLECCKWWTKMVPELKKCQTLYCFLVKCLSEVCSCEYSVRKPLRFLKSYFTSAHSWANWVGLDFSELLRLLVIPFVIESMLPEWTIVTIYLIVSLTVDALKWISTQFAFLSLES